MKHTITYHRVIEVESDEDMSVAEMLGYAAESLHDETGLWSISLDGDTRLWAL